MHIFVDSTSIFLSSNIINAGLWGASSIKDLDTHYNINSMIQFWLVVKDS